MIHKRRLLAVIPARKGSKGIPGKNLYKIDGLTLVELAMNLAKSCSKVDEVFVSTNDPVIFEISLKAGCATPSLRPEPLASDNARTIDVIRNLVDENVVNENDCILLLQPSSPIRSIKHIDSICNLFESKWDQVDAVVSVSEIEGPTPYKSQIIRNGYLSALLNNDSSVPRQQLPKTFIPNGAFYLAKTSILLQQNTFVPFRTIPYIMSSWESVNLDSPLDLFLLESMLNTGILKMASNQSELFFNTNTISLNK